MHDDITEHDLDTFVAAGVRLLGIPAAPGWQPAIAARLGVGLAFGKLVAGFALPDEAEPAPVFSA